MPRYYFDLQDRDGFHRDDIGDEFDDFTQAKDHAQALLPDVVREELPDGELHRISCDVRDENGRMIYRGELIFQGTIFSHLPTGRA